MRRHMWNGELRLRVLGARNRGVCVRLRRVLLRQSVGLGVCRRGVALAVLQRLWYACYRALVVRRCFYVVQCSIVFEFPQR